ncbi:MAG: zinc ribbon domain-containing protein [Bacteroidota bacterium]
MQKVYKNCQSCGMPLSRDDKGGGTNSDGTKSVMFCSHCYQQGAFTKPAITMDEMKHLVKGKLKEFGIPGFLTPIFTRHIPTLERWKV